MFPSVLWVHTLRKGTDMEQPEKTVLVYVFDGFADGEG